MAEATVELPEPRFIVTFAPEDLDWAYDNLDVEKSFLIIGVTNPHTAETHNFRIKISATDDTE